MFSYREMIIPAGNPVKKFPSGLQELYLTVGEYGQPPIQNQKLTEKNLKQLLKKIHTRKVLDADLVYQNRDGTYFNIEVNADWIAFQYVVNDGMENGGYYSSFNPDYLDSDEESATNTYYGSFMQLRYTMHDSELAAKCVEYFARTGELYPGTAWLASLPEKR